MGENGGSQGGKAPERESSRRWWSRRWWSSVTALGLTSRIERGRRYARAERVLSVDVEPGLVRAGVQGSRYEPYTVTFHIPAFSDAQWEEAFAALGSQALFSAKLLAGEMPQDIEEAFRQAGLSLFPESSGELVMECDCPDSVVPCQHNVALHQVLADRIDQDPFLLLLLRGRSREQILKALRQRRAAEASGRPVPGQSPVELEDDLDGFWKMGRSVSVSIGPPTVSASLLKRLGLPAFWKAHPEIRGSLERLYEKVTERAMALAYASRESGDR